MRKLRKPIFFTAGYNTVSFGSGRKEFHPKKPRPGLEHYITEAGRGVLEQINDPNHIEEGVIGNFMAARFNKQGNLASLMVNIDPSFEYKPMLRVEGACGSGGLSLTTATKTILSDMADVIMSVGVEVQNPVKAIYGADLLRAPVIMQENVRQDMRTFSRQNFRIGQGLAMKSSDMIRLEKRWLRGTNRPYRTLERIPRLRSIITVLMICSLRV